VLFRSLSENIHQQTTMSRTGQQQEDDPMANLSDVQINTLFAFSEITHIEDTNLCRSILAQNDWNLDVAVERYINRDTQHSDGGDHHHSHEVHDAGISPRQSHIQNERGGIFSYLLSSLRWLFQSTPVSLSPDQDTAKFVDKFRLEYEGGGDALSLNLEQTSYARAVQKAHQQSKFLLVYLHSPLHEDTNRFCTQVLHAENILQLVNGRRESDDSGEETCRASDIVTWAGEVWDPEAHNLSIDLRASAFPFVALLLCQTDRSVRVLDRIQGFIDHNNLGERLLHSINATRVEVDRIRNERVMRSTEVTLREDQDREYREAMEADRRQQEERLREEAERARAEEEAQQKQELDEALELSQQLAKQSSLEKKRALLRREPPAGENSSLIQFKFPQGTKVSQKFWKTDTVQFVYDFLTVHFADNNIAIENFMVSTNFPKKDLRDMLLTVEEVGLHPRGALFVHNLDS